MFPGCKITVFALKVLISNYILPNLVGLHGVSKLQCATTCLERASCKSFFYIFSQQSCHLSDLYVQDTAGLVCSNGTGFYSKPLPGCISKKYSFVARINACVLDQSEAKMTWDDAKIYCRKHHGMLMKAHHPNRHQFFLEVGKRHGYKRIHIGGKKTGLLWQWLDESTIKNDHWRSSGQDIFLVSAVNTHLAYCLCDGAYTWDDERGDELTGFLCESSVQV